MGWSAILVPLIAGAIWLWWWLYRSALPKTRGQLKAPGLLSGVTVVRDEWGVPHIQAQSMEDAAFGLGYVHVQDRLWQMEFNRRVGAGRLSELFGSLTLEADRFLRRMGLRRAALAEAAVLDDEERAFGDAYARGVNVALGSLPALPLECRLLGVKPEPWQVVDSLSWAKAMAMFLMHNWEDELLRYRLGCTLDAASAARLEAFYPAGQPVCAVPGGPGAPDPTDELMRLYAAAQPYLMSAAGASNNWVVAGSRTATGKPILANDPHLRLQLPSLWYEAHLTWPGVDVTGCTFPGMPGVVIGHNEHVGWGFTDAFADTADLYLERWHPTEAAVEWQGKWEPVETVDEVIAVKGAPSVVEHVHVTRHGPVLAGAPDADRSPASNYGLSLRWVGYEPGHSLRSLLRMNGASSASEFREALHDWAAPSLNMVFADTAGNIGYIMAGRVPVRAQGSGLTAVPGWDGEHEWSGWIPFEELPQLWNPESGYIVTANNKVVDGSYPHHLSWDYMPGYRAQRLQDLLEINTRVTVDDCLAMQTDVYCLPGLAFAAHCRSLLPSDELEQEALKALLEWDGVLSPESVGGAVYETMLHFAVRRAYGPLLGEDLLEDWLGRGNVLNPANPRVGRSTTALLRELQRGDASFVGGRPWEQLLAASLTDAVGFLSRRLGKIPRRWEWGRLHRLELKHAMGAVPALNWLLGGAEAPLGGDMSTPNQTAFVPSEPGGALTWAPSYRMVVDFADLSRSVSVYPGGQSGHPRSRHYLDLLPLYLRGEARPMPYGRVRAGATLHLEP